MVLFVSWHLDCNRCNKVSEIEDVVIQVILQHKMVAIKLRPCLIPPFILFFVCVCVHLFLSVLILTSLVNRLLWR
ncbi:hypothetical protein MUK42_03696 [Musa troglodytarum]|uniref:Uncharacterized protein n=1 Tax=Musa troglodytarum TaxID=320322 RepID=A0A9E7L3Y4_9LILI|nr:hypothetical protein MUK42_03696 [Musa troglodytarum]